MGVNLEVDCSLHHLVQFTQCGKLIYTGRSPEDHIASNGILQTDCRCYEH